MTDLMEQLAGKWCLENLDQAVEAVAAYLIARLGGTWNKPAPRFTVTSLAGTDGERWPAEFYGAVAGLAGIRFLIFREYFPEGPDLNGSTPFRYLAVKRSSEGVNKVVGAFVSAEEARDADVIVQRILSTLYA